ncbi:MAG: RimK family protein [Verrucomicrobiae bacterium]|nr:RimK family protein [Verrucomicrobiae bacterium]
MPQILCVVDDPEQWPLDLPEVSVVPARAYLTDPRYSAIRNGRVYNLCRSYRYQSGGYYVSLLAEARGHKPLPRIATTQDLKFQSLARAFSGDLEDLVHDSLAHLQGRRFELSIYFSRNITSRYDRLARALYNLFPVPLLRVHFVRGDDGWEIRSLGAISTNEVPDTHWPTVLQLARDYFSRPSSLPERPIPPRYNLAILRETGSPKSPSDDKAIERFVEAAERLRMSVELIEKDDYGRVAEFDALFLRATTAVNHHTYRFARRAEAEGLVVIDDTESIVKCTNKVFLAELLARHRIPTPKTRILHRDNIDEVRTALGLPIILKQPDSSFSQGVIKVESEAEYQARVEELLEMSDLLIAQEFLRTDFDWRIGIIDRRPLYACKYFMARNHWQIYNNAASGDDHLGDFETLPIEMAPQRVVQTALRAANLIGNGFYGVDLKVAAGQCRVIEINDNPSIDAGVEDKMLRRSLYDRVMEVFLKRLDSQREGRRDD